MLEIKDLHVQFHESDHEAVRGITLQVDEGEIMGLVGESGSGKTVTAMMIAGLLGSDRVKTRGQILLDTMLENGVNVEGNVFSRSAGKYEYVYTPTFETISKRIVEDVRPRF